MPNGLMYTAVKLLKENWYFISVTCNGKKPYVVI